MIILLFQKNEQVASSSAKLVDVASSSEKLDDVSAD